MSKPRKKTNPGSKGFNKESGEITNHEMRAVEQVKRISREIWTGMGFMRRDVFYKINLQLITWVEVGTGNKMKAFVIVSTVKTKSKNRKEL